MPNKLTDRRQKLLRFIIDEYVTTAQPVGSSALVEKYGLPVSPATIRNEMAALEYVALLVVVLEEARVLQQTIALDRPFSQEELTGIARKLNDLLAGKSAAQIREQRLLAAAVENSIAGATAGLIESTVNDAGAP